MPTQEEIKARYNQIIAERKAKEGKTTSAVSTVKATPEQIRARYLEIVAQKNKLQSKTSGTQPENGFLKKKTAFEKVSDVSEAALQGATDVAIGAGKGIVSTLTGAAKLGEKGLTSIFGQLPGAGTAEETIPKSIRTPSNNVQKAGFVGEQIAEFLVPGGASSKVGKVVDGAEILPKLPFLKKAVSSGSKVLSEAGIAAGQTAVQSGGDKEQIKDAGLYSAAFPLASSAIGKVFKGGGKVVTEVLGKTTGAGLQAIKEAFENPNVVKFARDAGKQGVDEVMEEALQEAKKGLRTLVEKRGQQYRSELSQLQMNKNLKSVYDSVLERTAKLSDDFDTIVEGKNVVDKAVNDVASWKDFSAEGMDTLKQRLQSYENQLLSREKAKAKRIVSEMKDSIRKGLIENVPGYENMTSGYRKASELINEIESALSLGERKQKETAIRKLLQTVRRDDDSRKELLNAVSEASGVDITGKITGTLLAPKLARGAAGAMFPIGSSVLGSASMFNPTFWLALIPYAAASSPKLVGEVANIAGKLKQLAPGQTASDQLQRIIRQVLLQIQKDNSN